MFYPIMLVATTSPYPWKINSKAQSNLQWWANEQETRPANDNDNDNNNNSNGTNNETN